MKEKIKDFILDRFSPSIGEIKDDTSLFASGVIDSLKLIEVIAFVEKTFSISVNMDDVTVENFDSVNNICKLINSKK